MNIIDAVANMKSGARMVRKEWAGQYVAILYGQSYPWIIGDNNKHDTINASVYIPSIDDLSATDWMVKK